MENLMSSVFVLGMIVIIVMTVFNAKAHRRKSEEVKAAQQKFYEDSRLRAATIVDELRAIRKLLEKKT